MNSYDDVRTHRRLVADHVRTRAFFDSITATVKPGDVVLDVGAGSGILSLFAARAGAARVYAVERAPGAAALARRLVALNGLADRVHVVEGDLAHVVLPERVDVLVSEWLGVYGVDEYMLGSVLVARDRYLKPNGRLIPDTVTSWAAPAAHPAGQEAVELHTRPYGLDLTPLAPFSLDQAVWIPASVPAGSLRAEPQPLWVVRTATMSTPAAWAPFRADCSFRLDGGGVNCLAVWFSASMPGAHPLSNGPGQPATHWGQFLFPLASVGDLGAGDELRITFECLPADWGGADHRWSASSGAGGVETHDTRRSRRRAWAPPWRVAHPDATTEIRGAD